MTSYRRNLAILKRNSGAFRVFPDFQYDIGNHPEDHINFECAFAAYHIRARGPQTILDVGSYRHFILGLLAHFPVTTIDVRSRMPVSENETIVTCDAKSLDLGDNWFDIVVSLCALEHFGLGRYGDDLDLDADKKAFQEMTRVLKPGGHLIFTTTVSRAQPSIAFNAHRIYSKEMIGALCANLVCVEEKAYSHRMRNSCSFEQVTKEIGVWDVYCGCWRKK